MTRRAEALGVEGLAQRARQALGGAAQVLAAAPGRINIIGEHTDTIGGLALPVAIDRHIVVALRRRGDGVARVTALDLGEQHAWRVASPPEPGELEGWRAYVVGSVAVFQELLDTRGGVFPGGFEAVVHGDVPLGSGVSSSAALCLAWINALDAWTELGLAPLERARLAQQVEHRWAGVPCGLLDQVASQCSVAGKLALVDFRELRVQLVHDGLQGVRWVLLHTGVQRALASSAYQQRVEEVTLALERSGLGHWRDLPGPEGWAALDVALGDPVWSARLRHGVSENARVLAAVAAVERGDAAGLGRLLDQSHASLRDDYAVSCEELDVLQQLATSAEGCWGARMMGGGFGGCVLALVEEGADFRDPVMRAYGRHFPARAGRVLELRPVGGAQGWRV